MDGRKRKVRYHIVGTFQGVQFSRMGDLVTFHCSILPGTVPVFRDESANIILLCIRIHIVHMTDADLKFFSISGLSRVVLRVL